MPARGRCVYRSELPCVSTVRPSPGAMPGYAISVWQAVTHTSQSEQRVVSISSPQRLSVDALLRRTRRTSSISRKPGVMAAPANAAAPDRENCVDQDSSRCSSTRAAATGPAAAAPVRTASGLVALGGARGDGE